MVAELFAPYFSCDRGNLMMFDVKRLGMLAASLIAATLFLGTAASFRAGADANPFITCSSPLPCVTDANSGSGPGLKSTSVNGPGLIGFTEFKSTTQSDGVAGVSGLDRSTSGKFDSGVKGKSTRGTGVTGISTSGPGVSGTSSSNPGVLGTASTAIGVRGITHGSSSSAAGIQGDNNTTATAVRANGFGGNLFIGNNSVSSDVFRVDDAGDIFAGHQISSGLDGSTAFGLEAEGSLEAVVGIGTSSSAAGVASTGVSGAAMYVATNSSNTRTLLADDSGNLTITGLIFTGGVCSSGCAKNAKAPGIRVITYAPREAAPTMEDVGEGQLVDGRSYVALDRDFATVIDQHSSYFVFITPEGDNRGLFVTDKTLRGFRVGESQGGHSTLPFSYRIVAKPFGPTQPRLARVNFAAQPRPPQLAPPAHYAKKR
jgi:hypothetical protein